MIKLAGFHLYGIGTKADEAEAARLLRIGADKQDPRCMCYYGNHLLLGAGVKKDVAAGVALIRKAAETGLAEAEYRMHQLIEAGRVTGAGAAEARRWLLLAAEHGDHDARADLAVEILEKKDASRARSVITWVKPGALAGHARSAHIMCFAFRHGVGTPADLVESMAWRLVSLDRNADADTEHYRDEYESLTEEQRTGAERRAQELSGKRTYASPFARDPKVVAAELKEFTESKLKAEQGDREAQYRLALLHDFGRGTAKDEAEAVRWYRKAAEQGHPVAQFNLAQSLRLGEGVAPDKHEAFAWYMKSALQGDPDAEYALSVCYQEGAGVTADDNEARKWLLKAAEHGAPLAQCNLGTEYLLTDPSPANDAMAVRWFRKAANQLHPKGCLRLGHCYLTGRGVPKDKIEGLAWMIVVGEELDADDKDDLSKIIDGYTEDEFKKAMERSRQLRAEIKAKLKAE